MNVNVDLPELIPIGKACSILGRSPRTIRTWLKAGKLHEHRDEHGRRYYRADELRELAPKPVATSVPVEAQ